MLYIRTDMNETIATGHMMRCLSIADAAKKQGQETVFLVADAQAHELLKKRGYAYRILGSDWNDMEAELPILLETVKKLQIKKLLIDSYRVTPAYLDQLSAAVKTYYIDDLNAFLYPVHGLICYANYWKSCGYPARNPKTELYLGLKYVPLREAFAGCEKKTIRPKVKNLLLMSGGSDPCDMTLKILGRLHKAAYEEIHVICGRYHTRYHDLCKMSLRYPNLHIHKAVDDIETYMERADLAVSAGGTTLYELCAVGTPAISYSFADNQLENVRTFDKEGIIAYAGDARKQDAAFHIAAMLERYHTDAALRRERSERMQDLVDGTGAGRIAEVLAEGI